MTESNEKQTPMGEVAERVAEASPAMFFPRMIELIHHNRQRKDHRRQIEHDRATHAAALRGESPPEWSKHDERDEEDDMGDSFSVAGDTTNHYYPAPEPAAPPEPEPATSRNKPTKKALSRLEKAALGAALVAAGFFAGAGVEATILRLSGAYDRPPATTTIQTSQDLGVGVEVIPGGAVDE